MKNLPATLVALFLVFLCIPVQADYSPWTFFGGVNFIYNSDGSDVTEVPGMQEGGVPGGLDSAPSPITGLIGLEYRREIRERVFFSPSISLFFVEYLWANDQALPAEIENRTAFVPSLLLDASFVYTIERNRFLFSVGGGPGILLRWAFLDSGVSEDEQSYSTDMSAGDQVDHINSYMWSSLRWFYPMLHAGVRYRLETGWGGGLTLRTGIPLFNLWSSPDVPFPHALMFIACITITPPLRSGQ